MSGKDTHGDDVFSTHIFLHTLQKFCNYCFAGLMEIIACLKHILILLDLCQASYATS